MTGRVLCLGDYGKEKSSGAVGYHVPVFPEYRDIAVMPLDISPVAIDFSYHGEKIPA